MESYYSKHSGESIDAAIDLIKVHNSDASRHVSNMDRENWDGKADLSELEKYLPLTGGIIGSNSANQNFVLINPDRVFVGIIDYLTNPSTYIEPALIKLQKDFREEIGATADLHTCIITPDDVILKRGDAVVNRLSIKCLPLTGGIIGEYGGAAYIEIDPDYIQVIKSGLPAGQTVSIQGDNITLSAVGYSSSGSVLFKCVITPDDVILKRGDAVVKRLSEIGQGSASVTEEEKVAWNTAKTTIDNHVTNSSVHITTNERNEWNTAKNAITSHKNDTTIHITEAEREEWNGKADKSELEKYLPLAGGILGNFGEKWVQIYPDRIGLSDYSSFPEYGTSISADEIRLSSNNNNPDLPESERTHYTCVVTADDVILKRDGVVVKRLSEVG